MKAGTPVKPPYEEISTISDDGQDSALDEDIDTPSYLRKGTGH